MLRGVSGTGDVYGASPVLRGGWVPTSQRGDQDPGGGRVDLFPTE